MFLIKQEYIEKEQNKKIFLNDNINIIDDIPLNALK